MSISSTGPCEDSTSPRQKHQDATFPADGAETAAAIVRQI
jgi:hypothetical protein